MPTYRYTTNRNTMRVRRGRTVIWTCLILFCCLCTAFAFAVPAIATNVMSASNPYQVTPVPQSTTPTSDYKTQYSINELYDKAMEATGEIVTSRMTQLAWLWGIGLFLGVLMVGVWLSIQDWWWIAVVICSLLVGNVGFGYNANQIPTLTDTIGHELADKAITAGVDMAQDAQATQYQYIHAWISQIRLDVQNCARTVNSKDFCSSNTPYFTYKEINVWYEPIESCTTDSDGKKSCTTSYKKHWDDEYTPWFTRVGMHSEVLDTKSKYLSEQIYHQRCLQGDSVVDCSRDEKGKINDSRKPVINLHTDWRAPENIQENLYRGGTYMPSIGSYNNRVPDS